MDEVQGFAPKRFYRCSQSNLARVRDTNSKVPYLRYNNFVSVKKIKLETHHKKRRNSQAKEETDSKLILCDSKGSEVQEVSLRQFLNNQCKETEELKNFFIDILNDLRDGRNMFITNVDLSSTTLDIEVNGNCKVEILKSIKRLLPDSYLSQFGVLSNSLEVIKGKQRDVIIRRKRQGSHIRHSVSVRQEVITTKVPVEIQSKKLRPPTSAEHKGIEFKISPLHLIKPKKLIIESGEEGDFSKISLRNYLSSKPETRIKIIHKDYEHLLNHEINQAIVLINKFIALTFKSKESVYDVETVMRMAKAMKFTLARKNINPIAFKEKELSYFIREQLNKYLVSIINKSNEYIEQKQNLQYKFFICKGNNGLMVRNVIKQRWWWTYGKKIDTNLLWTEWCKSKHITELPSFTTSSNKSSQKITNHFEGHYHLSNKKAMFINMQRYYQLNDEDPFLVLPLTFHVRNGIEDVEFENFTKHYKKVKNSKKGKNVWIIKPGEYSNRGCGIHIMQDYNDIKEFIASNSNKFHTYILQKYIEKPLLINKRKFDIRMFGMLTSVNGILKGYFYEDGYIRTSCKEYTLKNLHNKTIHLTNDAVQEKDDDYGKYESGNKISFAGFQKYLDLAYPSLNIDFYRDLLPQIKVRYDLNIENNNRYV